jgi:hypothetical protein
MIYAEPKIDNSVKSDSNQKDKNSSPLSTNSVNLQKESSDFDFDLISLKTLILLNNKYFNLFKTCSLKTVN